MRPIVEAFEKALAGAKGQRLRLPNVAFVLNAVSTKGLLYVTTKCPTECAMGMCAMQHGAPHFLHASQLSGTYQ